jgi:hypothetical protein
LPGIVESQASSWLIENPARPLAVRGGTFCPVRFVAKNRRSGKFARPFCSKGVQKNIPSVSQHTAFVAFCAIDLERQQAGKDGILGRFSGGEKYTK